VEIIFCNFAILIYLLTKCILPIFYCTVIKVGQNSIAPVH